MMIYFFGETELFKKKLVWQNSFTNSFMHGWKREWGRDSCKKWVFSASPLSILCERKKRSFTHKVVLKERCLVKNSSQWLVKLLVKLYRIGLIDYSFLSFFSTMKLVPHVFSKKLQFHISSKPKLLSLTKFSKIISTFMCINRFIMKINSMFNLLILI